MGSKSAWKYTADEWELRTNNQVIENFKTKQNKIKHGGIVEEFVDF